MDEAPVPHPSSVTRIVKLVTWFTAFIIIDDVIYLKLERLFYQNISIIPKQE